MRVNGPTRGTYSAPANGAVLSLTIPSPTAGNALILVFSSYAPGQYFPEGHGGQTEDNGYITISSITEGSAVWTKQAVAVETENLDLEIWAAPDIPSGLPTTIQITVNSPGANGNNNVVVDAFEYSGVATTSILDRTATNNGTSTASDTGTTLSTTQDNELILGATVAVGATQTARSSPNGFNFIDGVEYNSLLSLAVFEKFVTSEGTQNSGATISISSGWLGCIATFFGSASTQLYTVTTTDSLSTSDSITAPAIRMVTKTDSLSVSDLTAYLRIVPVALSSTVAISDSMASKTSVNRSITEPDLNLDDHQLLRTYISNPSPTESLSVGDSIVKSYISIRTDTDSLSITDSSIVRLCNPHIVDSLAIADSIATGNAILHLVSLLESLPINDSVNRNPILARTIIESLPIFDLIGISSARQGLSDALPIGDVIGAQSVLGRKIVETNFNISDDLTRFNLRTPTITDNVPITDSLIRLFLSQRNLVETLPVADLCGLIRTAQLTDSLLTSDGIVIALATGQLLRVLLSVDQRTVSLFAETDASDSNEH
jgi:hypothetical protein